MRGIFVLVVGPSGSGKDTLITAATAAYPDIVLSISCTTRSMRPGETDGVDYHFLSREAFEHRIAAGEFLEWAKYGENYYGTLRSTIDEAVAGGKLIMSDIEVQGVRQVRAGALPPSERVFVYVDAGPWEALERRITARAPITPEELKRRKVRYEDERTFKDHADYIVENLDGGLDVAKQQFVAVVKELRTRIGLPA